MRLHAVPFVHACARPATVPASLLLPHRKHQNYCAYILKRTQSMEQDCSSQSLRGRFCRATSSATLASLVQCSLLQSSCPRTECGESACWMTLLGPSGDIECLLDADLQQLRLRFCPKKHCSIFRGRLKGVRCCRGTPAGRFPCMALLRGTMGTQRGTTALEPPLPRLSPPAAPAGPLMVLPVAWVVTRVLTMRRWLTRAPRSHVTQCCAAARGGRRQQGPLVAQTTMICVSSVSATRLPVRIYHCPYCFGYNSGYPHYIT